jgi:hypothetical protein
MVCHSFSDFRYMTMIAVVNNAIQQKTIRLIFSWQYICVFFRRTNESRSCGGGDVGVKERRHNHQGKQPV